MISLSPLSAASLSSTKLTSCYNINNNNYLNKINQRSVRIKKCKAGISQEAPVVVGIGACILNSLVFPLIPERDDEDESPVIDSTDARMAVMGIISLIPYFNWLSWVFAWLDTGKQRYIVYALVYLAPYLRTSLSISPEESWLPISSIILCIIHMQLEASVRNGELQEFQIFRGFAKSYSVTGSKKSPYQGRDRVSEEEEEHISLPPTRDQSQSRNDVQGWGVPEKPSINPEQSNEDGNSSNTRKH